MKLTDLEQEYSKRIANELRENGFGESADEISRALLEKAIDEAIKMDLRGKNALDYLRGDLDFFTKRKKIGLTDEDLHQYWNREYVLIIAEYEMLNAIDDTTRLSTYRILLDQGQDKRGAVHVLRKIFAFFGNPDLSHQEFQGEDADIYPEFRTRYEKWRSMHSPESTVEQSKKFSTRNAFIRDLIAKGEL